YGLRGLLDCSLLFVGGGGPREVVVGDILGVAVIALQSAADNAHPRHVDVGSQYTKVINRCIRNNKNKIGAYSLTVQKDHLYITAFFGGHFGNYDKFRWI